MKLITICKFDLSDGKDILEESWDDPKLKAAIKDFYNVNLQGEEIFKEYNNVIITESGGYAAIFEDQLTKVS